MTGPENEFDLLMAGWLHEETAELVAQGATSEDLQDPAFLQLVVQRAWANHCKQEMENNEAFRSHCFAVYLRHATAEQLRDAARILREAGNNAAAYEFEAFADQREKGIDLLPAP